jgi:DNA-directed RNA polymerase subunit RPC12/RpoP
MTERKTWNIQCPYCHVTMITVYRDDWLPTADSEHFVDDMDGKHAICKGCGKKIQMEQPIEGIWVPARQ